MADATTITPLDNGPLLVNGPVKLTAADGTEIPVEGTPVALCRCGASSKKPFCDGSHKKVDFKSDNE